jgi:hypothetical protein
MSLKVDIAWLSGPGVRDTAEAATWAEVSIALGDKVVSRLLDERLNAVRPAFSGSVLPLVEWLVSVWPRLVHERRAPLPLTMAMSSQHSSDGLDGERADYYEWIGYHSLRAGRQGGAMPDVRIARLDRATFAIRSNADRNGLAPGVSVRFIAENDARVSAEGVQGELNRIVEATAARLAGVNTERVQALLSRWASSRTAVATIAGRLGADDEALSEVDRAVIEKAVQDPAMEVVVGIAEGSAAPTIPERLEQGWAVSTHEPQAVPVSKPWRWLEERLRRSRFDRPWLTGWSAAEEFRNAVGLGAQEAPGRRLPELLRERCGWPESVQLFSLPDSPTGVDTVYLKRSESMPSVLTTMMFPQASRFRLARGLYHFLFVGGSGDYAISDSPLLSGTLSEANAFAAELLAPVERIRANVPASGVWTPKQRSALARMLGVDQRVILHQIENHDLGMAA